jgi:hypothetical protein
MMSKITENNQNEMVEVTIGHTYEDRKAEAMKTMSPTGQNILNKLDNLIDRCRNQR